MRKFNKKYLFYITIAIITIVFSFIMFTENCPIISIGCHSISWLEGFMHGMFLVAGLYYICSTKDMKLFEEAKRNG